jgi:hypothetical protein
VIVPKHLDKYYPEFRVVLAGIRGVRVNLLWDYDAVNRTDPRRLVTETATVGTVQNPGLRTHNQSQHKVR